MTGLGRVCDKEVAFYRSVPKVHLHSHILGMVPPETFIELAEGYGVDLCGRTAADVYRYFDFTRLVGILSDVASVLRSEADYSRVIYEIIGKAYREECVLYSELFVQTTYHLIYGTRYERMVDGFADGIERAERDFGVQTRLILGLNRQLPGPIASHIVRQAIAYPSRHVIGIGLEDFEGFGPPEDFVEAYALAGAAGLHRTAHAGEHGAASNIMTSLTRLGCERIDHGYQATKEPTIAYRLADQQVHFTVCPTVASRQGWTRPDGNVLRTMRDYGFWMSINSDDPEITGSNLNREYALAAKLMGAERRELVDISRASIAATWLNDEEKRDLSHRFDSKLPPREGASA
ncbi:MAG: adenosine deaminase [Pseudodonghicola sp.]